MQYIAFTLLTLRDKLAVSDKERGATAVEYALIVAALSIVLVAALMAINTGGLVTAITNFIASIPGTGGATPGT